MYGFDGDKVVYLDKQYLQARRRDRFHLNQSGMAARAGYCIKTIRKFENGAWTSMEPRTVTNLLACYELEQVSYAGDGRADPCSEYLMTLDYSRKERERFTGALGQRVLDSEFNVRRAMCDLFRLDFLWKDGGCADSEDDR